MKTNIEEAALLRKFYNTFLHNDGDIEDDTVKLFAKQEEHMVVPEPDLSKLENGTIRIKGYNPTVQDGVVGVLKGQEWEVLYCNLENHAIRRLYTNFIGVDPVQSITVEKWRGKDIEKAGVQKIELMHMMYHRHVLQDKFGWQHIQEMVMPYRTQSWVRLLHNKCSKEKVTVSWNTVHEDYLNRCWEEMKIIESFEMLVQYKNVKKEQMKGHVSDKYLHDVAFKQKRQKHT